MMDLTISEEAVPGRPFVVEVEGEIDIATVDQLEATLRQAIADDRRPILLDLRRCSYMDSTGLRAVLTAHKALRVNGDDPPAFAVVTSHPSLLKLFELTRLDLTVPIVPTHEAAMALLDSAATLRPGPP